MNYIVDAFIAGFGFGVIAFVIVHLYAGAKLRKMRKLRDEMRIKMRSTVYPSIAGWWELQQQLESMPQREATRQELVSAYGKGQQNANANPRGTAQRSDTDAGT